MKNQTKIYQLNYNHYWANNGTHLAIMNEDKEYIDIFNGITLSQRKHIEPDDRGLISIQEFTFDLNIFQLLHFFKSYSDEIKDYNHLSYRLNKEYEANRLPIPNIDLRTKKTNPIRLEAAKNAKINQKESDKINLILEKRMQEINEKYIFPEGFDKSNL